MGVYIYTILLIYIYIDVLHIGNNGRLTLNIFFKGSMCMRLIKMHTVYTIFALVSLLNIVTHLHNLQNIHTYICSF